MSISATFELTYFTVKLSQFVIECDLLRPRPTTINQLLFDCTIKPQFVFRCTLTLSSGRTEYQLKQQQQHQSSTAAAT